MSKGDDEIGLIRGILTSVILFVVSFFGGYLAAELIALVIRSL